MFSGMFLYLFLNLILVVLGRFLERLDNLEDLLEVLVFVILVFDIFLIDLF